MKKIQTDLIFSLSIYIVLTTFLFQMNKIPSEARGYPMFMLIASAIINSIIFIKGIYTMKNEEILDESLDLKSTVKTIIFYIFIVSVYIFLINKISYIVATLIFVFSSLKYLNIKSKKILVGLPICLTFILYFVFTRFLMVSLPEGTWIYISF